jgi:carboxyl-terminal processing protease
MMSKIKTFICIAALAAMTMAIGRADAVITLTSDHIDKALVATGANYIEPLRIDARKMLKDSLNALQKSVPEIMVTEADGYTSVTIGNATKRFVTKDMNDIADMSNVMSQVTDFISKNYSGDIEADDMESILINGMLDSLDPHSNFLSKKIYEEFMVGTRGKFGGVGIVISVKDGLLTVIAPIEGTPAFEAGIKTGDTITQIEDESTINMSLTDAVNRLRGKPGTQVTIVTERAGKKPRKTTLTRAIISIDSVKHTVMTEGSKRIGYIGVTNFQSNTFKDFLDALKDLHKDGAKLDGLILDFRNNPGGLLNTAVEIVDSFLSSGTIVTTVGRDDDVIDKEVAHKSGTEPEYPLAVLINEGSASASEIVAGSLQANGRAIVLGSESFGKGSVQTVFELGNGTALKLTIARYMPAGTESIQLEGVMPDIEFIPVTIDKEEIDLYKDVSLSEEDLEEHLERKGPRQRTKQPAYQVRYLKQRETEETELANLTKKEYSKRPILEGDFEFEMAKKVLIAATKPSRESMVRTSAAPVEEATKAQDALIAAALKKLGVDWEKSAANGKPALKLTSQIIEDGRAVKTADAGKKVSLELTASNVGSGTFSQLIAIGQSKDNPFLSDLEFPFGLIRPGETKKWSTAVELPRGLVSENFPMELSFEEANGNKPKPEKIVVPISELPQPRFEISYSIPKKMIGKPFGGAVSVPLTLTVTNVGEGTTSDETAAALSDQCKEKVFIESGRTKLGAMAPKAAKSVKFGFHLLPGFDEANCKINISVADIKMHVGVTKDIALHPEQGELQPPPDKELSQPVITLKPYAAVTNAKGARLSVKIDSDGPLLDYYVFVGEKKLLYSTVGKDMKSASFDVDIPLEPGNNKVAIAARDSEKISNSKLLTIERK